LVWSVFIAISLLWNISHHRKDTLEMAVKEATIHFNKDQAFRYWVTSHGGVYVPVDERTPPNPLLSHVPERDIETKSGKKLTLMNPAYALRQLMNDYSDKYGIKGRITSLKLLNPANAPDEWEKKALKSFENGAAEAVEFTKIDGVPFLRFMRPMITEEGCLKCHAHQGYKVGDVRGGVGVILPVQPYMEIEKSEVASIAISHNLFWIIGLFAIGFVSRLNKKRIQEKSEAEQAVFLFRTLLDRSSDAITVVDPDNGRFLDFNEKFCANLGYGRHEIMGKSIIDIDSTIKDIYEWNKRIEELEKHEELVFESVHVRKDGYKFPVEVSVKLVREKGKRFIIGVTRDITERKRAEEALLRSEEKYRLLVESGLLIAWEAKFPSRQFTFVSSHAGKLTGYSEKEWCKQDFWVNHLYTEDREKAIKQSGELVKKGEGHTLEYRMIAKDGKVIWFKDMVSVIKDSASAPVGLRGFLTDITERKNMEDLAKSRGESLARAQEIAHIGSWSWDVQTGHLYWSDENFRLFGFSPQEFEPTYEKFLEILHPSDRESVIQAVNLTLEGGGNYDIEHRIVRPDGTVRLIHGQGRVEYGRDGTPARMYGTGHDITDQRKSEETMRLQSEMMANMGEGVLLIKADNMKIVHANSRLEKMFGYGEGELLDKEVAILNAPTERDPKETARGIVTLLQEKGFWQGEVHNIKKDGSTFWCFASIAGFDHQEYGKVWISVHADITENKRAEEEKLLFRRLVNRSNDMILLVDPESALILDINDKGCEHLGYDREELMKMRVIDFDATVSEVEAWQAHTAELEAKDSLLFESVHIRKDGARIPVEINVKLVSESGRSFIIGVVRDISDRKRAEEELRNSQKILARAQKIANIGNWTWDVPDQKFSWSDELYHILGLSEKKGKADYLAILETTHPEEREGLKRAIFDALEEKKPWNLDHRIVLEDGNIRVVHHQGEVTLNSDEEVLLIEGTLQDITERKEAERALEKSERNIRAIVKSVGEGIVVANRDSRVTFVNGELCEIFGCSEEEIIGQPLEILMPERFRESHRTSFKRYLEGGKARVVGKRIELEGLRKDGSEFPLELRIEESVWDHQEKFFVGAIRDITESRRIFEELRKAKEEAEGATKLKDKFVSMVSHDLKGPLGNMMGYLKLLLNEQAEPLGEGANVILGSALKCGEGMISLIEELLNISRLKTGKLVPQMRFHDLYVVSLRALSGLSYLALQKGIEIVNEIKPGARVFGDEQLLSEVVANVLSNSIKFSGRDSRITISHSAGEKTLLAIKDNGVGIPPEKIEFLFDYEVKTSTVGTAGETGTGLGLPLAMDIVKAHGGDISVDSKPDAGSSFTIALPVVTPRILVADDDEGVLHIIRTILADESVEIIEALDGKEAMELIREKAPHFIIADFHMPEIDGLKLLERVKKEKSIKNAVFFIMTSDKDTEIKERAFQLGADDFLNKPILKGDLLPRVRRYII